MLPSVGHERTPCALSAGSLGFQLFSAVGERPWPCFYPLRLPHGGRQLPHSSAATVPKPQRGAVETFSFLWGKDGAVGGGGGWGEPAGTQAWLATDVAWRFPA